jgi:hypothetical protein
LEGDCVGLSWPIPQAGLDRARLFFDATIGGRKPMRHRTRNLKSKATLNQKVGLLVVAKLAGDQPPMLANFPTSERQLTVFAAKLMVEE